MRNEIAYFTFDTTSGVLELKKRHLGKHRSKASYTPSVAQSGGILQALKDILNLINIDQCRHLNPIVKVIE